LYNSNHIEGYFSQFKIYDVSEITPDFLKKIADTAKNMSIQELKERWNSHIDDIVKFYHKEPLLEERVKIIQAQRIS
jgi:uncharacterized protein YqfB (UPF0267 family)